VPHGLHRPSVVVAEEQAIAEEANHERRHEQGERRVTAERERGEQEANRDDHLGHHGQPRKRAHAEPHDEPRVDE